MVVGKLDGKFRLFRVNLALKRVKKGVDRLGLHGYLWVLGVLT